MGMPTEKYSRKDKAPRQPDEPHQPGAYSSSTSLIADQGGLRSKDVHGEFHMGRP